MAKRTIRVDIDFDQISAMRKMIIDELVETLPQEKERLKKITLTLGAGSSGVRLYIRPEKNDADLVDMIRKAKPHLF